MTLVGEQEQCHRKWSLNLHQIMCIDKAPIIFTYVSVEIGLVPIYVDLSILRFHQLLS
jgi:hypothetical protein